MNYIKNDMKLYSLNQQGLMFNLLPTGDIYDITYQDAQINLLHGNMIDGGYFNVYLRVFNEDTIVYTPLIGKHSPSTFMFSKTAVKYEGFFEDVHYQVTLKIVDMQFNVNVALQSEKNIIADVIFGMDLAITSKGSVLNSEPYTVQYIDYKVFEDQNGYTLCARQNQGKSQFFQMGSFNRTIGYTTDGFQFFGLQAKETGVPVSMFKERLASEIYQYEFAYFALQSDKIQLSGKEYVISFYGLYEPEDHAIIEKAKEVKAINNDQQKTLFESIEQHQGYINPMHKLNGRSLNKNEWDKWYSHRLLEEFDKHELLSFFTDNYHHVVSKEKELIVERQHGHVLVHGDLLHASKDVMATTNWMFGVFSSHIVYGNTSFNKLLGDLRNPLNLQTISGLRIYIKRHGMYQLLGMPSFYDMGASTTRWVYLIDDHHMMIDTYVDMQVAQQVLSFTTDLHDLEDVIIVQQVLMNVNEHLSDIPFTHEGHTFTFYPAKDSMVSHTYPHLKYRYTFDSDIECVDIKEAIGSLYNQGVQLFSIKNTQHFNLYIQATFEDEFQALKPLTYQKSDELGTSYFRSMTNHMTLTHPKHQQDMNVLMHTLFWYSHNALIHYASPHGLEQYNGAAWGTRDVCQGPFEFFLANKKHTINREILLKVYKRQFLENGDFPQWFMFDDYYRIQAHESHGDIIIWPLRSLAVYLKVTQDVSILDEEIEYMSLKLNSFTHKDTLLNHVKKQVQAIIDSFIPNLYLPRYGGGDWDDTLQPANHDLTHKMVSGWTVALLYETLKMFSEEIVHVHDEYATELKMLAKKIKSDYQKHVIVDGIPAGFVVFDEEKTYLLHPKDVKTGLKYRLLPLTRSMIAEFVQPKDVNAYVDIIDCHLKHPDGVRLMNTAVTYNGGLKTYFTRAETAANFGREIGLQYVHAHIRYIEAMAKIGHSDDAYKALLTINPILITERVKNAYYRQSNMYFSSSDAWFKDRYEAKKNFDRIRTGDVLVKGGWRLYSSGPGIYINQLITNILGIQTYHKQLLIDPSIPRQLEGLLVEYEIGHQKYSITYGTGKDHVLINGHQAMYQSKYNLYKRPSVLIDQEETKKESIHIEIFQI